MYFTYLLGWSKFDKFYYGVRYKDGITDDCLCTTYFTSSKYVQKFIEKNGLPDIIQVRKRFNCKLKARKWEDKVIIRMKMIHSDNWLNKSNANSFRDIAMDNDIKRKISESKRGKKIGRYYNNGVISKIFKDDEMIPEEWTKGKVATEKVKAHMKKLNSSLTTEKRKIAGEKCSKKTKGKKKPEGHGANISKATKGVSKPWQKGENNVSHRPEVKEKISKAKKGKPLNGTMYNNGIENKFIRYGEEIPSDFVKGRIYSEESMKNMREKYKNKPSKRWYTNGIDSVRVIEGFQPEGWFIGRIINAKK